MTKIANEWIRAESSGEAQRYGGDRPFVSLFKLRPDSRPTSNPVQAEVAADGERLLLDLGLGLDLGLLDLGLGFGLDLGRNRLLGVRRRRARRISTFSRRETLYLFVKICFISYHPPSP